MDDTPSSPSSDTTLRGLLIKNGSLVVLAVLPIVIGSIRSLKLQTHQNATRNQNTAGTDSHQQRSSSSSGSSSSDTIKFPFIIAGITFGTHALLKVFSKEYIGPLISCYFCVLGVLALSQLISPLGTQCMPSIVRNERYHFILIKGKTRFSDCEIYFLLFIFQQCIGVRHLIDYRFTTFDIAWLILSAAIGVWRLVTDHWMANNLFAVAFAVEGIELLHLNNMSISCVLLGALFVYNIFSAFGADVMSAVAINLQGMLLLRFPVDMTTNFWNASSFAMLGICDIVVPGMFIAMLFRFDHSLKRNNNHYFLVTLCGYTLGLVAAFLVEWKFNHSQSPILYLVPMVLGSALALALLRNEVKSLFE